MTDILDGIFPNDPVLRINTSPEHDDDITELVEIEISRAATRNDTDVPTLLDLRNLHIDTGAVQIVITHLSADALDKIAEYFAAHAATIRREATERN